MFVSNLLLFASIIVVLALTPGPDVIYITTRGMAQGRKAALLSTVGICIGYLVYTLLAALGLSAMLQASAIAFNIVRYAGASYLVYLCIYGGYAYLSGRLGGEACNTAPLRLYPSLADGKCSRRFRGAFALPGAELESQRLASLVSEDDGRCYLAEQRSASLGYNKRVHVCRLTK